MYVKVHKKANKWYRNDTGALVGTEISSHSNLYKKLLMQTSHTIFIQNGYNRIITVYFGYFDKYGKFRSLKRTDTCKDKLIDTYVFVLN